MSQDNGEDGGDKDEWDNIDLMLMPKKAMCMSSHSKSIRGAANHTSKHAIAASYLTFQSTSVPVRHCGVHYSADKRGTRQEPDGEQAASKASQHN